MRTTLLPARPVHWGRQLAHLFLPLLVPGRHTREPWFLLSEKAVAPLRHPRVLTRATRCAVLYPYREPAVRELLWACKFRHRPRALAPLLTDLSDLPLPPRVDAFVPLPLPRERERSRGFNQSALIAEALARYTGGSVEAALARTRNTPPQSHLSKPERAANVERAFAVVDPTLVAGRTLVLVDDIVTTGATLAEARATLCAAGAREVWCVALAG